MEKKGLYMQKEKRTEKKYRKCASRKRLQSLKNERKKHEKMEEKAHE